MSNDGKQETGNGEKSLLLFQLGPVQDFIAQARSTRDMWSGSYMLSWLIAHAIKAVVRKDNLKNEAVVFPSLDKNPLVLALRDPGAPVESELALIPNLPNRFLMLVPNERANELAEVAKKAIVDELQNIGNAVWKWVMANGGEEAWKKRWDAQIKAFPQMTCANTPWGANETWRAAYIRVNELLAARRNTRDFAQWETVDEAAVKDSLSGKEEVVGTEKFWADLRQRERSLFKSPGHAYGAMNLIKRLWIHVDDGDDANYLASALNAFTRDVWDSLKIASLPEIALKNATPNNHYVAVLALDGDKMGERLSTCNTSPDALRTFSARLSLFALDQVRRIVNNHDGVLVYAGGDDVLAILPSTKAIACARDLATAFSQAMDANATASCGIAVGHEHAPLQMLVREAKRMESVAKNRHGRNALAIALYKRSGEIIEWGTKWDSGALDLMQQITGLIQAEKLSHRFPYALAELLAPYAFKGRNDAMKPVVLAEVRHVLSRQGSGMISGDREQLAQAIDRYLESTSDHLEDFINLFLAETFINRARGEA